MPKAKRYLINVGLALTVCFVFIVIFELVSPFFLTTCTTYKNCPSAQYSVNTIEYNMTVQLNSDGFRDKEFPKKNSGNTLMVIGDSFVFGWGVQENQTFVDLIEKRNNVKVFNLGVEGTGMMDYLDRFNRYKEKVDTVVLVYFTGNDILHEEESQNSFSWRAICRSLNICVLSYKVFSKIFENTGPRGDKNPLSKEDALKLEKINLTFFDLALSWRINPHLIAGALEEPNLNKHYISNINAFDNVSQNRKLLDEFITTAQRDNKLVIIVLIPPNFLVSESYFKELSQLGYFSSDPSQLVCNQILHSKIKRFLSKYNLELIDLQKEMCYSGFADKLYYKIDGHLTPQGHKFVTEILYDQLSSRKKVIKEKEKESNPFVHLNNFLNKK